MNVQEGVHFVLIQYLEPRTQTTQTQMFRADNGMLVAVRQANTVNWVVEGGYNPLNPTESKQAHFINQESAMAWMKDHVAQSGLRLRGIEGEAVFEEREGTPMVQPATEFPTDTRRRN